MFLDNGISALSKRNIVPRLRDSYTVVDPGGFAVVIDWIRANREGPYVGPKHLHPQAAEGPVTLSQATLSKWKAGYYKQIPGESFRVLLQVIERLEHREGADETLYRLVAAVTPPEAREYENRYANWLEHEFAAHFERPGEYLFVEHVRTEALSGSIRIRTISKSDAVDGVELTQIPFGQTGAAAYRYVHYQSLLTTLSRGPEGDSLEQFRIEQIRRGHEKPRVALAILRILEPLLQWPDSGFIERGWREFARSDLRLFIEAGITRERLMLDRAPVTQRALKVATSGEGLEAYFEPREDDSRPD